MTPVERALRCKLRTMISACHGNHSKPTRKQTMGIKVCEEWQGEKGIENFIEWALSHGYNSSLCIDRIDTYGDYCPENCRFITTKENNRNKTTTLYVEYKGVKRCFSELCEEMKIPYQKAYQRLRKGKTIEEIIYEVF